MIPGSDTIGTKNQATTGGRWWVTLSGRGQAQVLQLVKSETEPKAGSPYFSFSVHGPYTFKEAAAYAKQLGGEILSVLDSSGQPIGTVDVTKSSPSLSPAIASTTQDNSVSSENKRVTAAGGTIAPNPLDLLAGMLAPFTDLASVFNALYHQLTKASMWRSLGWLMLGGILFLAGVLWWAKLEGDIPDIVPVPV